MKFSNHHLTLQVRQMKRVSSTSSELNDFIDDEGKKIYNVRVYSNSELTVHFSEHYFCQVSKSRLVSLINWVHVIGCYLPYVWFVVVGILVVQVFKVLYDHRFDFQVDI